jgi:hypothetical protein
MVRTPPPHIGKDFNPGKARWCTIHKSLAGDEGGRLECTKQRKRGMGDCHMPAVRGTNTCKHHAGIRKEVAVVKGESIITAWSALGVAANGKKINPGVAVLSMLHQSWLRANAYGRLLEQQVKEEGDQAEPIPGEDGDGTLPRQGGLVGFHYGAAGKDGTIFVQSEEVRALVGLEASERDRVVKFAKIAHDMGISDRITDMAERWGDIVVGRMMQVMDGLNLSPEQQVILPRLVQSYLGHIDVSEIGGPE